MHIRESFNIDGFIKNIQPFMNKLTVDGNGKLNDANDYVQHIGDSLIEVNIPYSAVTSIDDCERILNIANQYPQTFDAYLDADHQQVRIQMINENQSKDKILIDKFYLINKSNIHPKAYKTIREALDHKTDNFKQVVSGNKLLIESTSFPEWANGMVNFIVLLARTSSNKAEFDRMIQINFPDGSTNFSDESIDYMQCLINACNKYGVDTKGKVSEMEQQLIDTLKSKPMSNESSKRISLKPNRKINEDNEDDVADKIIMLAKKCVDAVEFDKKASSVGLNDRNIDYKQCLTNACSRYDVDYTKGKISEIEQRLIDALKTNKHQRIYEDSEEDENTLSKAKKLARDNGYTIKIGQWAKSGNIYSGWVAVKDGDYDNLTEPIFVDGEEEAGVPNDKYHSPSSDEWNDLDNAEKTKIINFFTTEGAAIIKRKAGMSVQFCDGFENMLSKYNIKWDKKVTNNEKYAKYAVYTLSGPKEDMQACEKEKKEKGGTGFQKIGD